MQHRRQRHAACDVQCPDTLRTIDLVCGETHKIDRKPAKMDRQRAKHLYRINVKKRATRFNRFADLFDRLYRTDFIVGIHDADKTGTVRQCFADDMNGQLSALIDRQDSQLEAFLLQ
ncbi:hypothetical protein D3C84_990450 [compost metagenome]